MKMPSILSAMLAASLVFASCADGRDSADDPAALVDPLIGTDGPGNVYPGVSAPFGMVQLSPDNGTSGWDRIAGYFWPDTTIAGFSHTHLSGTGAGDLYDISYMPAVPPFKTGRGELGVYSVFSHDEETAQAGYYSVRLEDYDTRVELVATERCGMQRYTFPQTAEATVFLNLAKHMNWDYTMGSSLRVVDDRTVEGYRFSEGWAPDQRVWFVAQFSQPFVSYDIDTVVSVHSDSAYNGIESHIGKFVFDATDGAPVLVRTAISAVDIEGARRNLAAEMPDFAFDSVRTAQRALWNAELSKIEVKGARVPSGRLSTPRFTARCWLRRCSTTRTAAMPGRTERSMPERPVRATIRPFRCGIPIGRHIRFTLSCTPGGCGRWPSRC